MISRDRKILRICQAHTAPGMSLVRWREILAAYSVFPADNGDWSGVADDQVDAIFNQVAGIVKAARANRPAETIKPVDLYKTA